MRIRTHLQIAVLCAALIFSSFGVYAAVEKNTTADVTFQPGTLTLVEMTAFSFGTKPISGVRQDYPALQGTVSLDVHDLRGNGNGWSISAKADRFIDQNSAASLPGAIITLMGGTATTAIADRNKPIVQATIELDTDGTSADVVSAAVNAGLGNWTIAWTGAENANTNVSLYVPAGAATAGTHTATITWTLEDTPA